MFASLLREWAIIWPNWYSIGADEGQGDRPKSLFAYSFVSVVVYIARHCYEAESM